MKHYIHWSQERKEDSRKHFRSKRRRPPVPHCGNCGVPLEHLRDKKEVKPWQRICRSCREEFEAEGLFLPEDWDKVKMKRQKRFRQQSEIRAEIARFDALQKQKKKEMRQAACEIDEMIEALDRPVFPSSMPQLSQERLTTRQKPTVPLACLYNPGERKKLPPGLSKWRRFWRKVKNKIK